jgi:alpha-D-xyloside xylohydrolase
VTGGRWQRVKYDYMSMPLFARENSLIPVGNSGELTDYDYFDGLTIRAFAAVDARIEVYDSKGFHKLEVTAKREGGALTVALNGRYNNIAVETINETGYNRIEGAVPVIYGKNTALRVENGVDTVICYT